MLGATLPLCAILFQLRGSYLELNRRIGRYAQQISFLIPVKKKLKEAEELKSARKVVLEVERVLLGEVID